MRRFSRVHRFDENGLDRYPLYEPTHTTPETKITTKLCELIRVVPKGQLRIYGSKTRKPLTSILRPLGRLCWKNRI